MQVFLLYCDPRARSSPKSDLKRTSCGNHGIQIGFELVTRPMGARKTGSGEATIEPSPPPVEILLEEFMKTSEPPLARRHALQGAGCSGRPYHGLHSQTAAQSPRSTCLPNA